MSSIFLFGAGASYGSGPCHPYSPPLGANLFPELKAAGGIAATLDDDFANAFVDFEAGMDRFWEERNTDTTELLRDMARYFVQFEPLAGNSYLKLMTILGGTKKKAVMVTTNYDLMIEHAINKAGCFVTYGGFPVRKKNVPVLKIHGSCNFLPNVTPNQFDNISFDMGHSPNGSIIEVGVTPNASPREIIEFCDRENSVAPALAMYSPSKRVLYGKNFVDAQQQSWLHALSQASRIYVIGLRVHLVDGHIWGPLAKARAPIHYVGREPDAFTAWADNANRKAAYVLANSFEDALPGIAAHHGYRKPLFR